MAAPVREDGTKNEVTSNTTLTLTAPATVNNEDLLLAWIMWDAAVSGDEGNTPTGWIKINEAGDATVAVRCAAYYKVADGTEDSETTDFTWTTTANAIGFMERYSGVDPTTPINVTGADFLSQNDDTPQITAVTTDEDDCLITYGLASDVGATNAFTVASPWTERDEEQSAGGSGVSGPVGDRELATQGSSGTCDITQDFSQGVAAFLVGLNPIAAGGAITKIVNETLEISEGLITALSIVKLLDETLEINEATLHVLGLIRLVAATLQISEAENHVIGLLRQVDETVNVEETTVQILGLVRIQNETLEISEAEQHLLALTRIANESFEIGESLLTAMSIVKAVTEDIEYSEAIARAMALLRIQNETLEISEATIAQVGILKLINETLEYSETIVNIVAAALGAALVLTFKGYHNITRSFVGSHNVTRSFKGYHALKRTFRGWWDR